MEQNPYNLLPPGVRLRKYTGEDLIFAYPDGALFAEFSRPDGSTSTRLVFDHDQQTVRIDIDRLVGDQPAGERAAALFQTAREYPENIPPKRVKVNNLEIWLMRHLFLEGGRDIRVGDTAFVQLYDRIYRLQYYAHPDVFTQGAWVLEVILMTLQPVNTIDENPETTVG